MKSWHGRLVPTSASLLGRWIRLPLRLIPKGTVVPIISGANRGQRWVVGTSVHGCWIGNYEKEKQGEILRRVRPGMEVLDVGAQAGFYTLMLSRAVGPRGHVHALEPLPDNLFALSEHSRLNRLANVSIVPVAVSSRPKSAARFEMHEHLSMGRLGLHGNANLRVRVETIDRICAARRIIPDLIKMDIEGEEARALAGARQLLARRRTTWFIALHGKSQQRECIRILHDFGFVTQALSGTPLNLQHPLTEDLLATPRAEKHISEGHS